MKSGLLVKSLSNTESCVCSLSACVSEIFWLVFLFSIFWCYKICVVFPQLDRCFFFHHRW
jgi:hypothetical protein